MEALPYVDEHHQRVRGAPEAVWTALLRAVRRAFGGSEAFAAALRCEPRTATPGFAGPGDTIPGFRVAESEPGRRLVLRGRHRFSDYELTFLLDGDDLCAETRAAFPGTLGAMYRALVIGSRAHRVLTRRLLRQVARTL